MFSRFPGLSNMFSGPNHNNHRNHSPPHHAHQNQNYSHDPHGRIHAPYYQPQHHQAERRHNQAEDKGASNGPSFQIDNSWAIMSKISALYYGKAMSDITLVVSGKEYPSHRLILCASSDVFQVMLMNENWTEAQLTRIELQESQECAEHFEDYLKYLYTGIVRLELTNVLQLLILADKYNVKDLVDLCLDFMLKHIPASANANKLILWYQYLTNLVLDGHKIVSEACKNFIKWNFEFVAKANNFCELDLELLVNILSEDDLVVFDEFSLFQCVSKWVNSQTKKIIQDDSYGEKMLQVVQDSMDCIRFPMMSPRQLADLILSPLTQMYKDYFMEKMGIGMAFHSGDLGNMMDLILQHPHRSKLFTPRHYCTDKWSVCLSVDNFSSMTHYQSKTLVFSTPLSFSDKNDKQMEWVLDLYPKGVWFNKFYLIVWQGTLECPEQVMKTVRLSVHCKNSDEESEQNLIRVQIGILIAGVQNDVEHVRHVVKKNYIFSGHDKVLNFDNIVPYDELVKVLCDNSTHSHNNNCTANNSSENESQSTNAYADQVLGNHTSNTNEGLQSPFSSTSKNSCFFLSHDSFKIRIVITPMSEIKI